MREALADALEAEAGARAQLLTDRLGDAPELLAEARELLAVEDRAARLEPRSGTTPRALPATGGDGDPWLGRRVDRWRLIQLLGTGGMGSVYIAERVDAPFEQQVALKLLHAALMNESGRARFRTEQRILARLEHAGIARLIDGGVTAEGAPYLVMERVQGLPIDCWCDQQRLGLRERVELFARACDAVQYAHGQMVVHRDLKPSNLLVDGEGRPRLLDFGIARLLDPDPSAEDTGTGLRALTPRYASPEQVRGEPVATAGDVYSLGVLLYELLTGRPPYEVPVRAPREIERAVCESRPDRPSTVVTTGDSARAAELAACRNLDPTRLGRLLAGDLDTIVLKALAKEPERRYGTAGELADDLRRWIARRPVRARSDTAAYRASKFLLRNRPAVGAAALVVLALIVGLAATALQYREARRAGIRERAQRELADARFEEAQALVRTLVYGVHDRIAKLPGATPARLFLIERTRAHLEQLAGNDGVPPALLDDVAATYLRLGEVQGARTLGSVGDLAGAIESTRAALDLLQAALAETPVDLPRLEVCADAHRQLGDLLRISGRPREALEHYDRQRALAERALDLAPGALTAQRQLALSLGQAGRLRLDIGQPAAALQAIEAALVTTQALLAAAPDDLTLRHDQLLLQNQRGSALLALGRAAEALSVQREALSQAVELASSRVDDAQFAMARVAALLFTAETERALGEFEACRGHLTDALALAKTQAAVDGVDVNVAWHLLQAHEQLGDLSMTRGRLEESRESFGHAVMIASARVEQGPSDYQARRDLARLLLKEADAQWKQGDIPRARHGYAAALDTLVEAHEVADDPAALEVIFAAELGLGDLSLAAGARADAQQAFERLLLRANEHARLFAELPWPLRNLGLVTWRLGTIQETLAAQLERPTGERVHALEQARELYERGLDAALQMRTRGWLTPLELDVPEAFEADVQRCDEALVALRVARGG